jgi:hypothetical protein
MDQHARSGGVQAPGDGGANTPCAAGHQRSFPVQRLVHEGLEF